MFKPIVVLVQFPPPPKCPRFFLRFSRHHLEKFAPSEGRDLTLTSLPFFPIIPIDFSSPIALAPEGRYGAEKSGFLFSGLYTLTVRPLEMQYGRF